MTEYLTKQEIFDEIFDKLWVQGVPSWNYEQACLYRGEGGLKCGIGHIISDDDYKTSLEDCKVSSQSVWGAIPERYKGNAFDKNANFLSMIQYYLHDRFRDFCASQTYRSFLNDQASFLAIATEIKFTPRVES